VVFTNPADVVKTRMQMQNELVSRGAAGSALVYKSSFDCLMQTWRNEGLRGAQRGLGICMLRDGSKCFFRIGLFDPIVFRIHDTQQNGPTPIWKRIIAGACSGAVACVICNPLDLAKVRMQTAGGLSIVHHQCDTALSVFRSVVREHGVRGLWMGLPANMVVVILGTAALMPTTTKIREVLHAAEIGSGFTRDLISAFGGSVMLTLVTCPTDVVRTRIYNQPRDVHGRGVLYSSVRHALAKIFETEGVRGLYKGLLPRFLRVGPYTVLSFVFIGGLQRFLRRRKGLEP
jgi:solute carrier family 25 protein 34/35